MAFTQDNTSGYTDAQLAQLNIEAARRVPEIMEAYPGLDEDEAEKAFADEVARRPAPAVQEDRDE